MKLQFLILLFTCQIVFCQDTTKICEAGYYSSDQPNYNKKGWDNQVKYGYSYISQSDTKMTIEQYHFVDNNRLTQRWQQEIINDSTLIIDNGKTSETWYFEQLASSFYWIKNNKHGLDYTGFATSLLPLEYTKLNVFYNTKKLWTENHHDQNCRYRRIKTWDYPITIIQLRETNFSRFEEQQINHTFPDTLVAGFFPDGHCYSEPYFYLKQILLTVDCNSDIHEISIIDGSIDKTYCPSILLGLINKVNTTSFEIICDENSDTNLFQIPVFIKPR